MTLKVEIILFFIGVSAATLSFARDDSAFDRSGARSVGDSNAQRGGMRTPASAQEVPRAMAPSSQGSSASMYRPSGGGADRDASRVTFTPAPGAQSVRQPSAVVANPSREAARTTYAPAPAPQAVRDPNVPMTVPSRRDIARSTTRNAQADSVRTEQTRTTEVAHSIPAPVETRTVNAPRTSADHRSAAPGSEAYPNTQTPNVSAASTRQRTEAVATPHRTDAVSASLVHEPLDGRSNSFRTPPGNRTAALTSDARRDTWPTVPAAARASTVSRQEAAAGSAARAIAPDREHMPAVASLHSTRDENANDRYAPASVNRALSRPYLHESPTRLPSSGHSDAGVRRPFDSRASLSHASVSTALHQTNPYEPTHHYYPDRQYSPDRHHDAYRPIWFAPVVYPVGFGMTWSSRGSYAFAVSSCSPACAYSYSYMPYYDSWSYGMRGCSSLYYGGWRHGWYGGFSYVYNPWPVYSTCYFYDPPQVVTQTETVYVNQPVATAATAPVAETAIPTADAATPAPEAVVSAPEATAPTAMPPPIPASEAPPVSITSATVSNTPVAAARESIANSASVEAPPSEFEYPATADDFALNFASYAETLNAERIWSSYAGLDRSDPSAEIRLDDETAANSPR